MKVWRTPAIDNLELMRATFVRQRFSRHAHARFAVGVIEDGALGFRYRGEQVVAPKGAINIANPDEPHTGHAAAEQGWTYRMFAPGKWASHRMPISFKLGFARSRPCWQTDSARRPPPRRQGSLIKAT